MFVGMNTAVTPEYVTAPEMGVEPCFRVNEAVVIVSGSIASLNVAVIALLIATLVAASMGTVRVTVGAEVSEAAPVVKLQTLSTASAFPAMSLTIVVIVAV